MKWRYDSVDFPVAARKAITAGETLTFEIDGRAWQELRAHVSDNEVHDWAALAAIPELQVFAVVMALAGVSKLCVRVVPFTDSADVQVGSAH